MGIIWSMIKLFCLCGFCSACQSCCCFFKEVDGGMHLLLLKSNHVPLLSRTGHCLWSWHDLSQPTTLVVITPSLQIELSCLLSHWGKMALWIERMMHQLYTHTQTHICSQNWGSQCWLNKEFCWTKILLQYCVLIDFWFFFFLTHSHYLVPRVCPLCFSWWVDSYGICWRGLGVEGSRVHCLV